MDETSPRTTPRRSAAVILHREREGKLEVYLVERSPSLGFFAGQEAFPGGSVDPGDEALSSAERASFEREARRFANAQGYSVDWESVERLDDELLVNGVSQIAPFDAAAKQALLEAPNLRIRCELLVQLMQFFGRSDPDEGAVTLQ